ncbi:hypothetical protein QUA97_14830 [Microcoleus sp. CZ3-B2]
MLTIFGDRQLLYLLTITSLGIAVLCRKLPNRRLLWFFLAK